MLITLFDAETNGLDTENDLILELAWATYDVDEITNTWRLTECYSSLISWEQEYTLDLKLEKMLSLTKNQCLQQGHAPEFVISKFLSVSNLSVFIAGQNILAYDNKILTSNILKCDFYEEAPVAFGNHNFIDTLFDLPLPEEQKPKALKYFALDHGYVLNGAHQAMNDVFACAHVLSCYPILKTIEIASTPLVKLFAAIAYQEAEKKKKLYEQGFRWNPDARRYEKTVREFYKQKIEDALGFTVTADAL